MSDDLAAQAHALVERLSPSSTMIAQAERLLYFALVGAIEGGLVCTAEDAL